MPRSARSVLRTQVRRDTLCHARGNADKPIDAPCVYFCGNSLGPMPKLSKQRVEEELDIWAKRCAEAYTDMAEVTD